MAVFALQNNAGGCALCPTRQVCTARGLDPEGLSALSATLDTSAPMSRGDDLFRTGDLGGCWYVIRSGVYKTVTITAGGEEYVTGFYYPGELIGLAGQATGRQPETATALTSATVCRIELERVPELWSLGAGQSLLRLLGERQVASQLLHINLSQSKADLRIAGFLKLVSDRLERLGFDPSSIPTPMSRTDLANHLGLTLECLSRIISRWRKADIIQTNKDHIVINRADELRAMAWHLAV